MCLRVGRALDDLLLVGISRSSAARLQVAHRAARLISSKFRKYVQRLLANLAERAPRHSQRVAEELRRLRLLAAPRERDRQVARRDQRLLVFCEKSLAILNRR